jgi:hypothetical protein
MLTGGAGIGDSDARYCPMIFSMMESPRTR